MPKTVITKEIEDYILENRLKIASNKIGKHFGISGTAVRYFLNKNGLLLTKSESMKIKINTRTGQTTFSTYEDDFIKDNYLTMPVKTMEKAMNRSSCGIIGRLKRLNLFIPEEIIAIRKLESNFKRGHIPKNKGVKQIDYMSAESIEKTKVTRFQKGDIPKNALADGTETLRTDRRSGKVYTLVKIAGERKLKHKQIHIWETQNKMKLQKGFNIVFKDGNTQNFNIENLECISDSELMTRNSIMRYPLELKQKIFKLGKLKRTIKKLDK